MLISTNDILRMAIYDIMPIYRRIMNLVPTYERIRNIHFLLIG